VSWSVDDPLFPELFRFSWFLHGDRPAAMKALAGAFHQLSGKPEAAERDRAARFLFARLRKSAPKPSRAKQAPDPQKTDVLSSLRSLPEPERSLAGLFFATALAPAEISRILGHPEKDLARRLWALRMPQPVNLPSDGVPRPANDEEIFRRPDPIDPEASPAPADLEQMRVREFSRIIPDEEESRILADWANHLQIRAASWRPSPRDPAMIGLACGLVLLVAIAVWMALGSAAAFSGRDKVMAIFDEATSASADQYEPVTGTLSELGDWLALQGMEGHPLPSGFPEQRIVAARIFPFENEKVAAVLLPETEMAVFLFDGKSLDVQVKPVGEWKLFTRGNNAGAVVQKDSKIFMTGIRGSQEVLQERLEAVKSGL